MRPTTPFDQFTTRDESGAFIHTPLSNFSPSEISISGVYWKTVEHYYQAMKTLDLDKRNQIWATESPGMAKKLGRKVPLRDDWEAIKLLVMRQAIEKKFADGTSDAQYLLGTGDRLLIEGNTWGDRFWGVDGTGANWLGFILMAQRAALSAEKV